MTTIAVGRINDPEQAETIIAKDQADMVVMGRAHIADPQFCNKAMAGNDEAIVRCVGCNQGCNDVVATLEKRHITCLMNPTMGREKEFEIKQAEKPKKVLIIGGGIAGIVAATMLKERGHEPVLIEKAEKLGGQFSIAGESPRKAEFKEAIRNRGKNAINIGVDVRLNTPFRAEILQEVKPDEVIVATGAVPFALPIPGADREHVFQAWDILTGKAVAKGNVTVIGGGLVGMETAEYLTEKGRKVTVIEMLDEVAKDLGPARKRVLMEAVQSGKILTYTNTKCLEIKADKVIAEKNGEAIEIASDAVVFAVGAKPAKTEEIVKLCGSSRVMVGKKYPQPQCLC